jgi:hypothetical protein
MARSDRRDAQVLDASLTMLISGRASVADLLEANPTDAAWLEPLLISAVQARVAAEPRGMPAGARLVGERRLRAQIRSQSPKAAPIRQKRLRLAFRLASVAVAVALLASVRGVANAAEASLPGDGLYPVKQAIEQVQLGLSQSAEAEAELLVRLSEERLREAEQLAASGRTEDLPVALQGYGRAVGRLMELADRAPEQDSGEALQTLAGGLRRQAEVLSRIRDRAPEAAQPGLQQAVQQSTRNRERVEQMLETRLHEGGPPAERGKPATPPASQTPRPTQEKDKDSGKGQGRGRPTENP